MIFHKASEERKWKQWKEQEERILRESGVSEGVIQRLRELDWQDFNTERRYWEHFSPNQEELYTKELEEQSPVALTIQQLLDSVENEQLLQILQESDKNLADFTAEDVGIFYPGDCRADRYPGKDDLHTNGSSEEKN